MHQLTVEIPDNVYQPLLQKAKDRGQTVELMAQECLTALVQPVAPGSRLRKWAGALASGITDVGTRHDDYIGQALYDELHKPCHD